MIFQQLSPRIGSFRAPSVLALIWLGLGCQGRLGISNEPVQLPAQETPEQRYTDSYVDAGIPIRTPAGADATPSSTSCSDGSRNGDESDIDCGGTCRPCAAEYRCTRQADCQSLSCRAGLCVEASCSDGIINGRETAVDCGGDCPRCLSNTCNCATSAGLNPLSCEETLGARYETSIFFSRDGRTALYGVCYEELTSHIISNCQTFLWTQAAGAQLLAANDSGPKGISADGLTLLYAEAGSSKLKDADGVLTLPSFRFATLSRDGTHVVGVEHDDVSATLVRWTRAGGATNLAALAGHPQGAEVGAVTPDGSVIVGHTLVGDVAVPFRWTALGGLQDLGSIPGSATGATPLAVNADGSVIVGFTSASYNPVDLFRWTLSGGMEVLGPGRPIPVAERVFLSTDGSVIGGTPGAGNSSGVRWSFPGGADVLFPDAGAVGGMNSTGSILVGSSLGSAMLWDGSNATRFQDIAAGRGIDTTGWHFDEPLFVAEDGSFAFGRGLCGDTKVTYRLALAP